MSEANETEVVDLTVEETPAPAEHADPEMSEETPQGEDVAVGESEDQDSEDESGEVARPAGRSRRGKVSEEELIREGEIAADYLETLLDIADLDGDLDVDIDGDRASVAIVDSEDGRAPRKLIGPNGQVLDALQELTRLAVQAETGDRCWLMLDVAGHRADRRADLVRQAKEVIAEVKSSGEAVAMSPMSAFERKVVHDEVLAAGLRSESEGVEPRRHVVVSPA